MRKRKIKPNSYEAYAQAKAEHTKGPIDLGKMWDEDKELDPERAEELQK